MTPLDLQEKLAFLRSNNVTAMRASKSNRFSKQNNNFAFASLFFLRDYEVTKVYFSC